MNPQKIIQMLSTILIEDNNEHALILESLIKKNCHHISVKAVCNNLKDAIIQIEKFSPDLIMSDISLPGEDVFEFFDDIEEKLFSVVFVTAYSNFAIKAIKMHASDYILKPYTGNDLMDMEKRIVKIVEEKKKYLLKLSHDTIVKEFITIRMSQRTIKVNIEDIIMLKAQQSYTDIHLANGEIVTASKNIKYFQSILPAQIFFRTHKSYLVNMNHFKEMDTTNDFRVLLDHNKNAAISRRVLPKFNIMLKELIG